MELWSQTLTEEQKDRVVAVKKNFDGLRWKLVRDNGKPYIMSIGNLPVAFCLDGSDDEFIFDPDDDLANEVGHDNGFTII